MHNEAKFPKLLPHSFGDTVAGEHLVEKLNASGDRKLISKMQRHWFQYTSGLNDIMPCRNSTQGRLLVMWRDDFIRSGEESFGEQMRLRNIPYSYYENVLKYRYRKAADLGPLYQKLDS